MHLAQSWNWILTRLTVKSWDVIPKGVVSGLLNESTSASEEGECLPGFRLVFYPQERLPRP